MIWSIRWGRTEEAFIAIICPKCKDTFLLYGIRVYRKTRIISGFFHLSLLGACMLFQIFGANTHDQEETRSGRKYTFVDPKTHAKISPLQPLGTSHPRGLSAIFLSCLANNCRGLLFSGEKCLEDDILLLNVLHCRRVKIDDHETASSLKANGKIFFSIFFIFLYCIHLNVYYFLMIIPLHDVDVGIMRNYRDLLSFSTACKKLKLNLCLQQLIITNKPKNLILNWNCRLLWHKSVICKEMCTAQVMSFEICLHQRIYSQQSQACCINLQRNNADHHIDQVLPNQVPKKPPLPRLAFWTIRMLRPCILSNHMWIARVH